MNLSATIRHRHARAGLTLIEGLVVIGIMTMLLVVVAQIFTVNYDLVRRELGRTDTDTGAVLAMRRISELTRGAAAVISAQTINGTAYTSSATTLVLSMPSIDSSGNVLVGSTDHVAIYRDTSKTTQIFSDTEIAAGSYRVPGKKLVTAYNQVLTFRYNDPDIASATRVSVYILNSQVVRTSTISTKAWSSIFLRNF